MIVEDSYDYLSDIIGIGLQVPQLFNAVSGGFNLNTGKKRIEQSIYYILKTKIGERVFPPDFGSNLHQLVFEQNDMILEDLLKIYTADAIKKWEKRVKIHDVQVMRDPYRIDRNRVDVIIDYSILRTNVFGSYVYPFYLSPMPVIGG